MNPLPRNQYTRTTTDLVMGGCALLLIWLIFIVNRPPTLQGFSATIDASTYVTGDWLNRTLKNTMLLLV